MPRLTERLGMWWVHEVTVRRLTGTGPTGKTYGPVEPLRCFVDDKRRLVRDATGSEVVSETTISHPLTVPLIPLGSRVTLPAAYGGRAATVIASSVGDTGGHLDTPDHVELALT